MNPPHAGDPFRKKRFPTPLNARLVGSTDANTHSSRQPFHSIAGALASDAARTSLACGVRVTGLKAITGGAGRGVAKKAIQRQVPRKGPPNEIPQMCRRESAVTRGNADSELPPLLQGTPPYLSEESVRIPRLVAECAEKGMLNKSQLSGRTPRDLCCIAQSFH